MKNKPRILVVDDDLPILGLMSSVLTEFGFHPLTAPSGEEALELTSREDVDLILLDINMPGMSGAELIQKLRSERRADGVPILILSGEPIPSARVAQLGADEAVMKPFDLDALVGRIRFHLPHKMQSQPGQ